MGLFGKLKKKDELPEKDRKWNKMCDLWAEGEAAAPYAQLLTYDSEVNNGGHSQYFFNTANCGDLKAEVEAILPILPDVLRENLKRGYDAFAAQEDIADDVNDDLFGECDDVFYENEQPLLAILEAYAETMKC